MKGFVNLQAVRSYAEVGDILGISADAAYQREKSALRKLERSLAVKLGYQPPPAPPKRGRPKKNQEEAR